MFVSPGAGARDVIPASTPLSPSPCVACIAVSPMRGARAGSPAATSLSPLVGARAGSPAATPLSPSPPAWSWTSWWSPKVSSNQSEVPWELAGLASLCSASCWSSMATVASEDESLDCGGRCDELASPDNSSCNTRRTAGAAARRGPSACGAWLAPSPPEVPVGADDKVLIDKGVAELVGDDAIACKGGGKWG